MRARKDNARGELELQAVYSIAALARSANVTPYLIRRLLVAHGVTLVWVGRARLVPLSEIETKIPVIWESLRAIEALRRANSPSR